MTTTNQVSTHKKSLDREQMNVVIVGHVDHGKSTLVGRLLADTGSLPEGKLEAVKANCERNSKPFEYAFLLDALKDEQSQGITIDTARCFFKSTLRDYIIIDAPGHIEFLKNMISGAARAEAAMLVIDAKEGIRENSKRHGYMMSFLGIKNITVCVNKMDLVEYNEENFNSIKEEYTEFLKEIGIKPKMFIPISAREGDNIVSSSSQMPWYSGKNILEALDDFQKAAPLHQRDLRMPLQDIYKFTKMGDDRRIVAGRIESGTLNVGDEVTFYPSGKSSKINSIEGFNVDNYKEAYAGQSIGVTLDTQIYIKPGEILCHTKKHPLHVSKKFKANVFWMGKQPLVKSRNYKLKIATQQVPVVLSEILSILDASELSSITNKNQIDRHDVSECVFEALKPVAFDEIHSIASTGRFVIVDNYEIVGGGIILAPVFDETSALNDHIKNREFDWERGRVTNEHRAKKYTHKSALVVLAGEAESNKNKIAKILEEKLFEENKMVYYLGVSNKFLSTNQSHNDRTILKLQQLQQLGEFSHIMNDAGLIVITTVSDIDEYELKMLKSLNQPYPTLLIGVGDTSFSEKTLDLSIHHQTESSAAAEDILMMLNRSILVDPDFSI